MTSPVFVCFYTSNYYHHAKALIESLDAHDLAHDVLEVTNRGSWQANCLRKPAFLRAMLHKHKGPIVWIDADARVRRAPTLLIEMAAMRHVDVGVHIYGLCGGRRELLSGTIYLGHTPAAHALLDAWQVQCVQRPGRFDQENLQRALEQAQELRRLDELEGAGVAKGRLRVSFLPPEYCFIWDTFREDFYVNSNPDVGEPVIEHLQASRAVRKREREEQQT